MTVCVAALCQDGEKRIAVAASDRMVTYGGFIEFEHAESKMTEVSSHALVMVSGDTLIGTRLARDVADQFGGAQAVADIATRLAAQYEATRNDLMEQQILALRALNHAAYYDKHNSLNPQVTFAIDQQMTQFNPQIELLLAGVDPSGAHIFTVHNPGRPERLHDVIGYAAVGSGTLHALQSMIGFGHSASAAYHETVFRVYASKRRAEVAPGVGHDTDLAVISDEGIHRLTPDELAQLATIYDDFQQATSTALTNQLENFTLGGDDDDAGSDDNPADGS